MQSRISDLLNQLYPLLSDSRKSQIEKVLQHRTRFITVVLEEINKSHNAGAIIRNCDCFGIQDIHVLDKYHSFDSTKYLSRGASKWIDQHVYPGNQSGLDSCLKKLKSSGYRIVATSPHADSFTPRTLSLDQKTALVFGSEKTGISETIQSNADAFLSIPQWGFSESFNVSVAVAIILSALRQRLEDLPKEHWALNAEEREALRLEWTEKSLPHGQKMREYFEKQLFPDSK